MDFFVRVNLASVQNYLKTLQNYFETDWENIKCKKLRNFLPSFKSKVMHSSKRGIPNTLKKISHVLLKE